jgi:hypothetical protein
MMYAIKKPGSSTECEGTNRRKQETTNTDDDNEQQQEQEATQRVRFNVGQTSTKTVAQ